MPSLRQSPHFVPEGRIPSFPGGTPFREVYQGLERSGTGGFLLVQGDLPASYVRAYPLAEKAIAEAKGDVEKLQRLCQQPIQEVVTEFSRQAPVVPVHTDSVDVKDEEGPLQQRVDTAFLVKEVGRPIGWYLNHESVLEAQTERAIFICRRGHRNTDPDSGSCWKCPAPIVRTEKEMLP
jgi:hypothetical protein